MNERPGTAGAAPIILGVVGLVNKITHATLIARRDTRFRQREADMAVRLSEIDVENETD